MPTYEYECQKCGHRFDEFQSITAKPLSTCRKAICPKGGARGRLKRLISGGGGLLFKGSGFYETDYRSDSYKKAAKADSDSSSGSESKTSESETKTSKGETKTSKGETKKSKSESKSETKKGD
ncbi:MAG: FmdB family zinc ribbon protein [Candidatus Latescibacterota bacterium]|jgi:putative FmdB family regulatory protein